MDLSQWVEGSASAEQKVSEAFYTADLILMQGLHAEIRWSKDV